MWTSYMEAPVSELGDLGSQPKGGIPCLRPSPRRRWPEADLPPARTAEPLSAEIISRLKTIHEEESAEARLELEDDGKKVHHLDNEPRTNSRNERNGIEPSLAQS